MKTFLSLLFSFVAVASFGQGTSIKRNYYTTNDSPSSPTATNVTIYNTLNVSSNINVQNVTVTNSLTVKGKSTVNIQVTSNLYAVPITNKVLYSDSTGLVSGIPNANGVLTNNGTAFGFGAIPALGGIDITGTNGVIITTNGSLRIAGLDPSIASALTNVSTNWVIYSTNIYVNNSYVSNYFVTNVFQNTFMSNYYNTNLYTFVTNQYTTNVSVTNTFTTFNNSYVSNFYQTNIFQDTFNSNYFYTNLFVTTNVFTTNIYVNTGVFTNDNNNIYPVIASPASLWFLPGGAARGTNTIDLLAKRTSINNVAAATGSTLVGGLDNGVAAGSDYGIVAGGVLNFIDGSSTFDAIVGGSNNEINNGVSSSFIGGGDHNLLYGPRSAIISGGANSIYGDPANLIAASTDSTIGTNSGYASIIAGDSSTINGAVGSDYFSILGGLQNHIVSPSSGFGFILGGRQNAISANHAWTIGDFLTNATASSIDLGFSQTAKVRVDAANLNLIGTMALKQTNGASAGFFLESDASGVGSWSANGGALTNIQGSNVANVALLNVSNNFTATSSFPALVVTNLVAPVSSIAGPFLTTNGAGAASFSYNAGAFTNLPNQFANTNYFNQIWLTNGSTYGIAAWPGATNHLDLLLATRQEYTLTTAGSITGLVNIPPIGFERSVVLTLTNSTAGDLTFYWTAGALDTDQGTAASWVVTNKSKLKLSIAVGDDGTNLIARPFWH